MVLAVGVITAGFCTETYAYGAGREPGRAGAGAGGAGRAGVPAAGAAGRPGSGAGAMPGAGLADWCWRNTSCGFL
jgi:hypothetical protein